MLLNKFKRIVASLLGVDSRRRKELFLYDEDRFYHFSGTNVENGNEALRARIIVSYHVLEKGLTMPNRRYGFGQNNLLYLISLISTFEKRYGFDDAQTNHAVGVIKAYYQLHLDANYTFDDVSFVQQIKHFISVHSNVNSAPQAHVRRDEFYSAINAPFRELSLARHTTRHYQVGKEVSLSSIQDAVSVAMTAPSACNRQHVRVHCLMNKKIIQKALDIQGGSRGFGHDADKLLVITGDLLDSLGSYERNDVYINGGIFIMNLCYALYCNEIAHCILSASLPLDKVEALREVVGVPDNETIVALICCGVPPDEFDVATSPRKSLDEIFSIRN